MIGFKEYVIRVCNSVKGDHRAHTSVTTDELVWP